MISPSRKKHNSESDVALTNDYKRPIGRRTFQLRGEQVGARPDLLSWEVGKDAQGTRRCALPGQGPVGIAARGAAPDGKGYRAVQVW